MHTEYNLLKRIIQHNDYLGTLGAHISFGALLLINNLYIVSFAAFTYIMKVNSQNTPSQTAEKSKFRPIIISLSDIQEKNLKMKYFV